MVSLNCEVEHLFRKWFSLLSLVEERYYLSSNLLLSLLTQSRSRLLVQVQSGHDEKEHQSNHVQCPVAGFEMYNCVQMQGHLLHLHAALWQPSPGLRHNSVNRSSASLCDCLVHGERLWLEAGKGISLEANVGVHEY